MEQEIRFKIGDQDIWFDRMWHCGSHEVDIGSFFTIQEAVDYAVWVLQNPDLHAKEFE